MIACKRLPDTPCEGTGCTGITIQISLASTQKQVGRSAYERIYFDKITLFLFR